MPHDPLSPPADGELDDGTVSLRTRRAADLEEMAAASHDPVTRHWLEDLPMDAESVASSLDRAARAWAERTGTPLVIADSTSDVPLGLINLRFPANGVAAVAYSVFPLARGRGIAPRAVRLMAGWAFASLGVRTLLLEADVANTASVRVAEKCGFVRGPDRVERPETGPSRRLAVFELTRQGWPEG